MEMMKVDVVGTSGSGSGCLIATVAQATRLPRKVIAGRLRALGVRRELTPGQATQLMLGLLAEHPADAMQTGVEFADLDFSIALGRFPDGAWEALPLDLDPDFAAWFGRTLAFALVGLIEQMHLGHDRMLNVHLQKIATGRLADGDSVAWLEIRSLRAGVRLDVRIVYAFRPLTLAEAATLAPTREIPGGTASAVASFCPVPAGRYAIPPDLLTH